MNSRILTKSILSILFFLLFILIFIIWSSSSTSGYEISIYDIFPFYFWGIFIIIDVTVIGILITRIFYKKFNVLYPLPIIIFVISNFLFLSLSLLRGYFIYGRGDTLDHLSMIRGITNSGELATENFYPGIHLIGSILQQLIGLNEGTLIYFLIMLFYSLYLVGIFLISKQITRDRDQFLLLVLFSLPFLFSLFHVLIHPSFLSLYFVPILLYLYHKKSGSYHKRIFSSLLLLISCILVISHPVTAVYILFLFFSLWIFYEISSRRNKNQTELFRILSNPKLILFIILSLFFSWISVFSIFNKSAIKIIGWLFEGTADTITASYVNILSSSSIPLFTLIQLFLFRYGIIALYLFVSFFAFLFFIKKIRKGKSSDYMLSIQKVYSVLIVASFTLSFLFLVGYFIESDAYRVFRFFLIISIFYNGLVLYSARNLYQNKKKKIFKLKKISVFLILGALSFSTFVGIFSVYKSPLIAETNFQVTRYDISGNNFFINVYDGSTPTMCLSNSLFRRFERLLVLDTDHKPIKLDLNNIPTHFGYEENNTFQENLIYTKEYLIFSKYDLLHYKAYPKETWDLAHVFTNDDIFRLKNDYTIFQIYENGEYWMWKTI